MFENDFPRTYFVIFYLCYRWWIKNRWVLKSVLCYNIISFIKRTLTNRKFLSLPYWKTVRGAIEYNGGIRRIMFLLIIGILRGYCNNNLNDSLKIINISMFMIRIFKRNITWSYLKNLQTATLKDFPLVLIWNNTLGNSKVKWSYVNDLNSLGDELLFYCPPELKWGHTKWLQNEQLGLSNM